MRGRGPILIAVIILVALVALIVGLCGNTDQYDPDGIGPENTIEETTHVAPERTVYVEETTVVEELPKSGGVRVS